MSYINLFQMDIEIQTRSKFKKEMYPLFLNTRFIFSSIWLGDWTIFNSLMWESSESSSIGRNLSDEDPGLLSFNRFDALTKIIIFEQINTSLFRRWQILNEFIRHKNEVLLNLNFIWLTVTIQRFCRVEWS